MKQKKAFKILIILLILCPPAYFIYKATKEFNPNRNHFIGQKLDSLNGVYVFYNGGVGHCGERNVTEDGYNIGLKYQCVEFVKRYYYQYYHHKMPDAYGNAKDFFDIRLKDNSFNRKRGLMQFCNGSCSRPIEGDLLVFDGHTGNSYGHVAIISNVGNKEIEIIQQNPGPFSAARVRFDLEKKGAKYFIQHDRILGWLRLKDNKKI